VVLLEKTLMRLEGKGTASVMLPRWRGLPCWTKPKLTENFLRGPIKSTKGWNTPYHRAISPRVKHLTFQGGHWS
jgi:hypothetical protein